MLISSQTHFLAGVFFMLKDNNVTHLLGEMRSGNSEAIEELTPLIVKELHRLAKHYMRGEAEGHTLQATALVNEAYMKLVNMELDWQSRAHFFAVAATQMRRILVDHARFKLAEKRGGKILQVTLEENLNANAESNHDLIYIDELLSQLNEFDARAARLFELRLFAGLSNNEIAAVEDISISSVEREIRVAKAWLLNELKNSK
jgi:RNA polymerase sigma factor (TIGR02999 family)